MAKHPALFLAFMFCGGFLCQRWLQLPLLAAALLFLFSFCSALFLFFKNKTHANWLSLRLLNAVFCAGMLHLAQAEKVSPFDIGHWAQTRREVVLLGEIVDAPTPRHEAWRAPLRVIALREGDSLVTKLRGRVLVTSRALRNLQIADHVLLRGRLQLAEGERNPGAFDYHAYLRANNMSALFFCPDSAPLWHQSPNAAFSFARWVARVAAWIERCLATFSSGQERALLKGLLLGRIEELDASIMENFARTGFIHVLSVSGLHVGFIALMLVLAASLLRIPPRRQWPPIVLALAFYAALTGLDPPIVRATIMASVILYGRAHERDTSLPNDLSIAALFILWFQPLQFFQLGFQLSFAAMFGLAYLHRPLLLVFARFRKWRALRWAYALLIASVAAQLATLPVLVVTYGRLPFAAILGNVIVIPLSFMAVAMAALACLFAPVSSFVMHAYGVIAELSAAAMIACTNALALIPFSYIEGIHFPPLLLLFYCSLLALLAFQHQPMRSRLVLLALLALNLHVWHEAWQAAPRLRITFFDVGQGDAALLEFPQGRRLLIDTGPWLGTTNAGARVLVPYFQRQGIRRLHGVIISHPHADHLGGLPALLTALQIDTVYRSAGDSDSELERDCERLLDSLQVPSRVLHAGERLFAGSVAVLCSGASLREAYRSTNLNETSVVLKIVYGQTALLFPGDAERFSEEHLLLHARALDSDLLKVGHHGSRTSSAEEFLRAVTPRVAVISVGKYNLFAHPHAEVLQRYQKLGITTERTDEAGALIFETDGGNLAQVHWRRKGKVSSE